ncbi:glycosyltransferase family 4 protein [Abyssicoccus albus]|uniref:glycosyltransferase family 4 protein n=1 Tax=Abyssicoccus albus TaxID=1817405 RepID=UPI001372C939|nr:glycosyltransferase family 4 protein [Abyssicoccus albus]
MDRILFISHIYPSKDFLRQGYVIHKQAIGLKENGYVVDVISPLQWVPNLLSKYNKYWNFYNSAGQTEVLDNIKVYRPKYFKVPKNQFLFLTKKNFFRQCYKMIEKYKIMIDDYDIIHSHIGFPDSFFAYELSVKYNKKLIISVRMTDILFLKSNNNELKKKYLTILNSADNVISISDNIKKILWEEFQVNSHLIGNGVDSHIFFHKPDIEKKYDLITVSNLIKSKNHELVLRAIYQIKQQGHKINYIIIGNGPHYVKLKEIVEELNLKDNVIFKGELNKNEINEILNQSKVFVMPSLKETFGLVYLEAALAKVPSIFIEGQGIDGVFKNEVSGIKINNDITQLIEAVLFLLESDNERKFIGQNAHDIATTQYNWNFIVNKIIEVYNE